MILLAIDTSLGTSVALTGDDVSFELSTTDTRSHAERIGPFIHEALRETSLAPQDVSGVVAGLGPGAFTGLRVGIAAAIAFAAALDIPVYGVPSHDAHGVLWGTGTVVSDVRRRELAWTTYRDGVTVGGPALTTEDKLANDVDLEQFPEIRATEISARALADAARIRLDHGDDLSSLAPIYLRAPDVTPSSGPKRVSQ